MIGNFSQDGEYCVELTVGGEAFCLDLDTGSSDVGINAAGCSGCTKKTDAPYDPSSSPNAVHTNCSWCDEHQTDSTSISCKTVELVGEDACTMMISYEDGSGFSAALYEDTLAIGGAAVTATIGAIYSASGWDDPKSIDGIIGFAGRGESNANAPTPFDVMVSEGRVDSDVFSLCLRADGGTLYMGSTPGVTDSPDVLWTPRLSTSDFYSIEIQDVMVGGASIGVDADKYLKEAVEESASMMKNSSL
jgi:hypothetical protein